MVITAEPGADLSPNMDSWVTAMGIDAGGLDDFDKLVSTAATAASRLGSARPVSVFDSRFRKERKLPDAGKQTRAPQNPSPDPSCCSHFSVSLLEGFWVQALSCASSPPSSLRPCLSSQMPLLHLAGCPHFKGKLGCGPLHFSLATGSMGYTHVGW